MRKNSFVLLFIIFAYANIAFAEDKVPELTPEQIEYNNADIIKLSTLACVKPLLSTKSPHYTISENVRIVDPYYVFDVTCPHGEYRVKSVRALMKICHEIDVLENFRATKHGPQVFKGAMQNVKDIGRGAGMIVFHPGQASKAIVRMPARLGRMVGRIISSPFRKKNQSPDVSVRTKGAKGFLYSGEILRAAYQLKLDAYTDNVNVQALLRSIGKQRKLGGLAVSVALPSSNLLSVAKYAATPGALKDHAKKLIAGNNAQELRRVNAKLYREELGIYYKKYKPLKKLINNYYYSPREQTYIRLYLTAIKPTKGLRETIVALAEVNTPEQAIYYTAQLHLLLALHNNDSPLVQLVPLNGQIAAVNKRSEFMFVAPYDVIRINDLTRSIFASVIKNSKKLSAHRTSMWFTGDVSWDYFGLARRQSAFVRQNVLKDPIFTRVK